MSKTAAFRRRGGRKTSVPVAPLVTQDEFSITATCAPGSVQASPDLEQRWSCYWSVDGLGDPTTRPGSWNSQGVPDSDEIDHASWTELEGDVFYRCRFYGGGDWSPWSESVFHEAE